MAQSTAAAAAAGRSPDPHGQTAARRLQNLRRTCFAALVMLAVQGALGDWLNLNVTLPQTDRGRGVAAAFAVAVATGPAALAAHALLGAALLLAAATVVVRALAIRGPTLAALATLGLLATLAAALSGAGFVGGAGERASLAMAAAAALATLAYAGMLFALGGGGDAHARRARS